MSCEILKKNLSELVVKIGGWIDFEDRAVEAITKIQKKFPTLKYFVEKTHEIRMIPASDGKKAKWFIMTITISADVVRHEGYTFIGTLSKVELEDGSNSTMIYSVEGYDLSKYIGHDSYTCDHCGTNRHRNTVFIFRHEESGADKIFATKCVTEYFGINIGRKIWSATTIISEIGKEFEDEGFGSYGKSMGRLDKELFLTAVVGTYKTDGFFISGKMAGETGRASTSQKACGLMPEPDRRDFELRNRSMFEVDNLFREAREKRKAILALGTGVITLQEVIDYWNAKDGTSDTFTSNVQIALMMVEPKPGIIAYAVCSILMERAKEQEAKAPKLPSEYFGELNKRYDLSLEVVKVYEFESVYGISNIVSMKDEKGNRFTWKTGDSGLNEGSKIKIKGTVVKHEEYKGTKTTYISRCKVSEEINLTNI